MIHKRPVCGDCRWELGEGISAVQLAQGSDLWFGRIAGAALDGHGRLYVADVFQRQVIRVDLESGAVLRLGRAGRGPGEFEVPQLIAPAGADRVFVLDPALGRISEFTGDGSFRTSFPLPLRLAVPSAMVAGDGDHLFVSAVALDSTAGLIHKFDFRGRLVGSFGRADGPTGNRTFLREGVEAGVLWWDAAARLLWFSRAGPQFDLAAYGPDGVLLHRVGIVGSDLTQWQPPVQVFGTGERLSVRGTPSLGTVALLSLGDGLLANVSVLGGDSSRIDVFDTLRAQYLASWVEVRVARVGVADGQGHVLAFRLDDEPDVLVHDVQFGGRHSLQGRNR